MTMNESGSALSIAEADLRLNTGQPLPNGAQSDVEGNNAIFNNLFVGNSQIGSGASAQWQTFTGQTCLSGQNTALTFSTLLFNTAPNLFSYVTTPITGIRVAQAGSYILIGLVQLNGNAAAATYLCGPSLVINSTNNGYSFNQIYVPANASASNSMSLPVPIIWNANAGDVFGLTFYQNSGANLSTTWVFLSIAALH